MKFGLEVLPFRQINTDPARPSEDSANPSTPSTSVLGGVLPGADVPGCGRPSASTTYGNAPRVQFSIDSLAMFHILQEEPEQEQ
jgi:hypothetical protein